jgi:peptidoglycan endopeptidase LytF
MDRKKTIFVAALANAGLLVILFITALTRQEEIVKTEIAQKPLTKVEELVLPKEEPPAITVLDQTSKTEEIAVVKESPVTYKLPAAEKEVAKAPVPRSALEIVVKKGDSLDKIAKAHQTSVDEIIKLNQLPGSFLKVGQVLKIPTETASRAKSSEPSTPSAPEYYTMKVGDNPWGIAMKHHMKLEELLKLNQLNEEKARKLKPGDKLKIR